MKNGTPVGNKSICDTCKYAHIVQGFRESEVLVYCTYVFDQAIPVPFKVAQCTSHDDRNRPTWEQMEKLAIDVQPISSAKPAGFRLAREGKREIVSETIIE